jgi:hypothetical protein
LIAALFNEELGAVVQIRHEDRSAVMQVLRDAGLGASAAICHRWHQHGRRSARLAQCQAGLLSAKRSRTATDLERSQLPDRPPA